MDRAHRGVRHPAPHVAPPWCAFGWEPSFASSADGMVRNSASAQRLQQVSVAQAAHGGAAQTRAASVAEALPSSRSASRLPAPVGFAEGPSRMTSGVTLRSAEESPQGGGLLDCAAALMARVQSVSAKAESILSAAGRASRRHPAGRDAGYSGLAGLSGYGAGRLADLTERLAQLDALLDEVVAQGACRVAPAASAPPPRVASARYARRSEAEEAAVHEMARGLLERMRQQQARPRPPGGSAAFGAGYSAIDGATTPTRPCGPPPHAVRYPSAGSAALPSAAVRASTPRLPSSRMQTPGRFVEVLPPGGVFAGGSADFSPGVASRASTPMLGLRPPAGLQAPSLHVGHPMAVHGGAGSPATPPFFLPPSDAWGRGPPGGSCRLQARAPAGASTPVSGMGTPRVCLGGPCLGGLGSLGSAEGRLSPSPWARIVGPMVPPLARHALWVPPAGHAAQDSAEAKIRDWLSTIPIGNGAERGWDEEQILEIADFAKEQRLEHLGAEEIYKQFVEYQVELASRSADERN